MNIANIIAGFISGLLCAMGFGAGSVLIVYLTTFLSLEQKTAQGINLIFFIPCAILSILFHKRKNLIQKDGLLPIIIFGIIGVIAGYFVLDSISSASLSKIFGGFILLLSVKNLINTKRAGQN